MLILTIRLSVSSSSHLVLIYSSHSIFVLLGATVTHLQQTNLEDITKYLIFYLILQNQARRTGFLWGPLVMVLICM